MSTIQIKRGTGSAVPSGLSDGELAINLDNNKFYFGTGSTVKNDLHLDTVTASSDISASGTITAEHFYSSDDAQIDDDLTVSGDIHSGGSIFKYGELGTKITFGVRAVELYGNNSKGITVQDGSVNINTPIANSLTASADISASGTIYASRIRVPGSLVDIRDGHITASGNIEVEGNISSSAASTASFAHIITQGTTIEFKDGATKLGQLKFDADDGLVTEDSTGKTKANKLGLTLFNTASHTAAGTTAQGEIVKFPNQGSLTAGSIYMLKNDGNWAQAQANGAGTSTGSLAVALGTNAQTHGMLLRGMVKLAVDPQASIGSPLYLNDTSAGRALKTAPDSNNDVARVIGYYMSGSGVVYFNPDNTWVVVTA